jgi:hypothetical protein
MIVLFAVSMLTPAQVDQVPIATEAKPKTSYVCKTVRQTGSIVKKASVCLTRKQWARVNDEAEQLSRKMVYEGGGTGSY